MNLKEIKDAARQAFRDQQLQDTEGGVSDAVSYCAGFLAGARHVEQVIDRAELIQTNREDVLPAAQEAAHYTWLDGRVQFLEDRNLTLRSKVECLNQVNDGLHLLLKEAEAREKKLVEALKFYENCSALMLKQRDLPIDPILGRSVLTERHVQDNGDVARQVLKEVEK